MKQYNIPILGFAGFSGSGKTTMLEKIIPLLKEKGLRLAVVKHDGHRFEIDREGKDSWRYSAAGADEVLLSSSEMTAVKIHRPLELEEALKHVGTVDLILIEGYKYENFSQVGISRKANGKGLPEKEDRYFAIVTDREEDRDASVPTFGFEDEKKLAEYIFENRHRLSRTVSGSVKDTNHVPERKEGLSMHDSDSKKITAGENLTAEQKENAGMTELGNDFTHFNDEGRAHMVNVGEKAPTSRTAVAAARVHVNRETFEKIQSGGMKKGDVLTVAQIAGIMGAKRTPDLIPMCHPILIHGADLSLSLDEEACTVEIQATISCDGKTGVEMEALTAVSVAALTVYDMCKAVQKDMMITDIRLLSKTGGIHGDYRRG